MKALFDTCVVIDVLQRREPFWEDSYHALYAIANRRAEGFLTAKSLTDIYYLTHRITHDKKKTRKIISDLLVTLDLLDTSASDCRRALLSDAGDFEDAVMMETAVRCGMNLIVTRNVHDYQVSTVPIYTPQAFVKQFVL